MTPERLVPNATATGNASVTIRDAPADFEERFAASMPVRYRVLFDARATRLHAAIAHRRAGRAAEAGVWRELPDGTSELCIVADDRPGLLVLIAAVLASHGLSVQTALLFARTADTTERSAAEAVDLFWVRRRSDRAEAPLGAEETAALGDELRALIGGAIDVEDIAPGFCPREGSALSVRFEAKDDASMAVLTIDAADAPALLLVIARTLYDNGAQIVRSIVRTVGGRAHNRFDLLGFDGAPLPDARRARIRLALEEALAPRVHREGAGESESESQSEGEPH